MRSLSGCAARLHLWFGSTTVLVGLVVACGSSRDETRRQSLGNPGEDQPRSGPVVDSGVGELSSADDSDAPGLVQQDAGGSPGGGEPPTGVECPSGVVPLADKRLVRLTTRQIITAVGDLISSDLAAQLLGTYIDPSNRGALPLMASEEGPIFTAASLKRSDEIAAASGLYVKANTAAVTGCVAPVTQECVTSFVQTFAAAAYRRPLAVQEQQSLSQLVEDLVESGADASEAARWGVFAILSAPQFLYRTEFGSELESDEPLNPHEFAEALAFFLTDGPPDAELRAAVDSGNFGEVTEWRYQASRLLQSERARLNLTEALVAYFRMPRLTESPLGTVDAELRASMQTEVSRLFRRTIESGELNELLTSKYSYLDERLARFYGASFQASDVDSADGFLWTPLPEERRGLLTTAAFLTTDPDGETHSVVQRGMLVRSLLECATSIEFGGLAEEFSEAPTERAAAEERLAHSPCKECHIQIDPYGLVFERFDGLGRLRNTDDDGSAVRTDSTLADGSRLLGVDDLVERLTDSQAFSSCLARHWLTYGLAEPGERPVDACAAQEIMKDFATTERRMTDLLLAVVSSASFRMRAGKR